MCVLLLGGAAPAGAQSGEVGSVCVRDHAPGTSCSGSDVEATELALVEVVDPCGADGTAHVIFDLVLEAATDRYDLSAYVALDGGSAESGALCYHDYLAPPLTTEPVYGDANANLVPDLFNGPWVNLEPFVQVDDCGDMQGGTEAIATLASESVALEVDCVDTNDDGNVDLDVCVGWRNSNQDQCTGLSSAVAAGNTRCSCGRLELTGLPEPGAGASLAAGALLLAALRRRGRRPRRAPCQG